MTDMRYVTWLATCRRCCWPLACSGISLQRGSREWSAHSSAMGFPHRYLVGKYGRTVRPAGVIQRPFPFRAGLCCKTLRCVAKEQLSNPTERTDAGHFVRWRREGLLAPFLPEDAAKHLPPEQIGADGMLRDGIRLAQPNWLQHQSGQARGCPDDLRRSARPPHGRAKSSKEIRTTAAPSLPRRLRSRASWAGPISRGSPSRRSCRWSHRAIHRIGSPAARVPCKPTVPTPNFCCCESEARRWKVSMPARARR